MEHEMKAAYYEQTGPAERVLVVGDLPDPQPAADEVRVRLEWSGVNPSDVKARSGARGPTMPFPRVIPHSDGMGVIDAVGADVDPARIGQRVWVWNAAWARPNGTAAGLVVLPQQQAVALPDNVPGEVGACLGIPALTAARAVLTDGGVAGQRVLVAGGAGAVGHYAVQFARLLGARQVITTVSSPAKAELARMAGADVVIDYRSENVVERVREATAGAGVDRIIEVDIAANAAIDMEVVCPDGMWVVYGSGARQFSLPFFPMISRNILVRFFIVYQLSADNRLRANAVLDDFLRRNLLQHNIAARLPLASIAQAHELVEAGSVVGNVLVSID
jgi:NADPH:quinone reductase